MLRQRWEKWNRSAEETNWLSFIISLFSIWSHLLGLVTEHQKTIIITTHYIEEARQASVVGMMRNGHLLAEDAPNALLERFSLPNLEDVFLKLCVRDNSKLDSDETQSGSKGLGGIFTIWKCYWMVIFWLCVNSIGTLNRIPIVSSISGGSADSKRRTGGLVYPGITAMAEDHSIQPISYAKAPEESEFEKIKRRLSMKVQRKSQSKHTQSNSFPNDELDAPGCCQPSTPSPRKMWALMMKNLIKLWRNKRWINWICVQGYMSSNFFLSISSQLLFAFLLPAIQVIFFCVAIGRDPTGLKMAVVNNELAFGSNCTIAPGCDFSNLSCR